MKAENELAQAEALKLDTSINTAPSDITIISDDIVKPSKQKPTTSQSEFEFACQQLQKATTLTEKNDPHKDIKLAG